MSTSPVAEVKSPQEMSYEELVLYCLKYSTKGNKNKLLLPYVHELAERSYEFNRLDSFVRTQGEGKLSTEETSQRITVALQSFQRLISNLSLYGLFQGTIPSVAGKEIDTETLTAEWSHFQEKMAEPANLISLIAEIYCAGGVNFSRQALPPLVQKAVEDTMKKRGKIFE